MKLKVSEGNISILLESLNSLEELINFLELHDCRILTTTILNVNKEFFDIRIFLLHKRTNEFHTLCFSNTLWLTFSNDTFYISSNPHGMHKETKIYLSINDIEDIKNILKHIQNIHSSEDCDEYTSYLTLEYVDTILNILNKIKEKI